MRICKMTSEEFSKMEKPWPDNIQELTSYIEEVRDHWTYITEIPDSEKIEDD